MGVKTYAPSEVSINFGGFTLTGYADGSFISIENEADAFTKVVGADGEVTRTASANRSARITLTLVQTSDSNLTLSTLVEADRSTFEGALPLQVKDNNGNSLYTADAAWIVKHTDSEFANEMGTREWMFDCAKLVAITGGSND